MENEDPYSWEPRPIPYQLVLEVQRALARAPAEDQEIIMSKPKAAERAADARWRRTCAKYGISTSPVGKSADRTQYSREYALRRRIEELEANLRTCVKEPGVPWNESVVQSVVDREALVGDGAVRTWLAAHMHGECIRKMYGRIDSNPFAVCEVCRAQLQALIEVVAKGAG